MGLLGMILFATSMSQGPRSGTGVVRVGATGQPEVGVVAGWGRNFA
jgi:hypothetical protein